MNNQTNPRLIYATIFVLASIEYLQSGMTAFAAAPIMGETSVSPDDFSLVAAAYASVAIFSISMQRWWVERIGGRRFLQGSLAISMIGALVCAASGDFMGFLAGRVIMGLGVGAFFTSARMMIHHLLPPKARFSGIKFLAGGLAASTAAAPWLASVSVANESWSAIYLSLAVLGVLAFVLVTHALPDAPVASAQPSQVSLLQQVLLSASSFLLLYGMQRAYYDFYGDRSQLIAMLSAAVLGLLVWGWQQFKSSEPLLRVREMLHVRYLAGLLLFLFVYTMLGANNTAIPAMLLHTLGFGWATVGEFEALGLSVAVITWVVMTRLLPRFPAPRKFLITGFVSLAIFGLLMSQLTAEANLWRDVLPALAFNSIFLLTVLPITAMQTFRELDRSEAAFANAQQLKNIVAQIGIALGISLATIGQQWRAAVHADALTANLDPGNPAFAATVQPMQDMLSASLPAGQAMQVAIAQVAQLMTEQASLLANLDHFTVVAVLGTLGIAVTSVQRIFR